MKNKEKAAIVDALKDRYTTDVMPFIHSLSGTYLDFGKRFMKDLQNAGYYDVADPDELKFTFGQIAGAINKVTGDFSYPGSDDVTDAVSDYSSQYYYDDSYFLGSAYDYNDHLSTMSLCLELSVWPSTYVHGNYTDSKTSVNAQNLFTDIGFVDFETNPQYNATPDSNTIGVGIAHAFEKFFRAFTGIGACDNQR